MKIRLPGGHLRTKKIFVTQIHGNKNKKTVIALSSHNIWIIVCYGNNNFHFVFIKQSDVSAIYFSYIGMCYIYFFVFTLIRKTRLALFMEMSRLHMRVLWRSVRPPGLRLARCTERLVASSYALRSKNNPFLFLQAGKDWGKSKLHKSNLDACIQYSEPFL